LILPIGLTIFLDDTPSFHHPSFFLVVWENVVTISDIDTVALTDTLELFDWKSLHRYYPSERKLYFCKHPKHYRSLSLDTSSVNRPDAAESGLPKPSAASFFIL